MTEFWTVALPILLLDVANPVLLAAVILTMTSKRPYANALTLVAGHTLSYTLFGLVIIFGFAELIGDLLAPLWGWLSSPQTSDFVVGLLVGLALIWVAFRWRIDPPKPSEKPSKPENANLLSVFFFGVVINFVGTPFAIPYFAFINQLMRVPDSLVLPNLLVYNALYAIPFLLVPLSVAILGKSIMPVLELINKTVEKYSAYIMPVGLGLAGLALVADAVLYFITGRGLI